MSLMNQNRRGLGSPANLLEGMVEIFAYRKGELFYHDVMKNIILFQGQAEIIRAISIISPATKPRVIARMAIGDQGTIPSDSTVPKVPTKDMTGLFHETYRKDIDSRTPTLYSTSGFAYNGKHNYQLADINCDVFNGWCSDWYGGLRHGHPGRDGCFPDRWSDFD